MKRVIVTKVVGTKNVGFFDTKTKENLTCEQFCKLIKTPNTYYNKHYYIKNDSSGKTPVSKSNGSLKDNLESI